MSLETLLAAANFVEANDSPNNLARGSLCYFTIIVHLQFHVVAVVTYSLAIYRH